MYEVRYTIDGIIKTIMIKADDAIQAQQIFTNMYSSGKYQIIDVVRR